MQPDNELLRQYARAGSESAFTELVKRHVNLVYSAALRQAGGDAHLAHDVAQSVFTDLARKASSLCRHESLTGWLYTSAYFAASKMVRTEIRRREREEQFMREPGHDPAPDAEWEKLRPILDAAMHGLKDIDRVAVLLRYFENRPYAEVAAKLGVNENAARMRVERSLEKLRVLLSKRAITTTTGLAAIISANAVQIAPPTLAATLSHTSLAAVGAGTSFAILKLVRLTQIKVGLGALVVAGAAATFALQHHNGRQLRDENESLRQQLARLNADLDKVSNQAPLQNDSANNEQHAELLRLRAEVTQLRAVKNPPPAPAVSSITNNGTATNKTEITVKARFLSVTPEFLTTLSSVWSPMDGSSLISDSQFEGFKKSIQANPRAARLIGEQEVTTLNGRQANVAVVEPVSLNGTNVNVGTILDIIPYYSTSSSSFTLDFTVQLNELVGTAEQPIFSSMHSTNEVHLFPGQTAILISEIEAGSKSLPEGSTGGGTLLIFITPTAIDSVGNRILPGKSVAQ